MKDNVDSTPSKKEKALSSIRELMDEAKSTSTVTVPAALK